MYIPISIYLYSIVLLYYMFLISYIIPGQKQYCFCVPAERLISSILFSNMDCCAYIAESLRRNKKKIKTFDNTNTE